VKKKDKIRRFPRKWPYRFPRRAEGIEKLEPADQERYRVALQKKTPNYQVALTPKMRKAIRLLSLGRSVNDVALRLHMHPKSIYRWQEYHPLFRATLLKKSLAVAQETAQVLDSDLPRAAGVVNKLLHSGDIMLEYMAAKDLLRGRGFYTHNVAKRQETSGTVTHQHFVREEHGLTKETLQVLVDALTNKTMGAPAAPEYASLPAAADSVIDVSPVHDDDDPVIVRELPE
jgi:hypothetical protein